MPVEPGEKHTRMLLSAVPLSCNFCLPGGPESMVEVRAKSPVKYRDGAASADRDAVVQGLGAQKLETVRRGNGRTGEIALLKLPVRPGFAARRLGDRVDILGPAPAAQADARASVARARVKVLMRIRD